MKTLQSKQHNRFHLEAEFSYQGREGGRDGSLKHHGDRPMEKLQRANGTKCRFLFSVLTHTSGLCACAQCAKSNTLES